MSATIVADFKLILGAGSCLKAEGNMRKLVIVSLGLRSGVHKVRTYPVIIKSADRVAAALQYHSVWSFSV